MIKKHKYVEDGVVQMMNRSFWQKKEKKALYSGNKYNFTKATRKCQETCTGCDLCLKMQ